MKKFIIGMTALTLTVCLTACGSSTDATISDLSSQLDKTSNTIISFTNVSPSEITFSESEETSQIYTDSKNAQEAILNEQYYKAEILEKTAKIKDLISKDVKLSSSQRNALKDHILTLDKYTQSIDESKKDMNLSVRNFSTLRRNTGKNKEKIEAKLNQLACNENLRSAYYENLINTLEKIENCLDVTEQETVKNSKTEQNSNETEKEENIQTQQSKKNIDTFDNERKIENDVNNRYKRHITRNIDTYGPRNRNIDGIYNPYYNTGFGRQYVPNFNYGYQFQNGFNCPPCNNFNNPYLNNNSNNTNRLDYENIETPQNQTEDSVIASAGVENDLYKARKSRQKVEDEDDRIVVAH